MDFFAYKNGQLFAEDVAVADIAAQYQTPVYVYSRATLERHWHAFNDAIGEHPHLICYAVKANSNLGVLSTLAKIGSGFDIVSGGELARVIEAGGDASKVVFSGVGKKADEIRYALDCHIGSQLTEIGPFVDALERLLLLIDELAERGITIDHLDVGGGLGVTYNDEEPPHPKAYAAAMAEKMVGRENLKLILEPGRAIAANAGILVTEVEFIKEGEEKSFAIVDAAMNDLLRPALYSAWQNIIPVKQESTATARNYDVVGPVCETGDFIGKDRELAIEPTDLLAVRSAGAYGFAMASNYNSRCRPAEIMVDGDATIVVREREILKDLWKGEHKLT